MLFCVFSAWGQFAAYLLCCPERDYTYSLFRLYFSYPLVSLICVVFYHIAAFRTIFSVKYSTKSVPQQYQHWLDVKNVLLLNIATGLSLPKQVCIEVCARH